MTIESLLQELSVTPVSKTRAQILNRLALRTQNINVSDCLKYASEALEIAEELNDDQEKALSLKTIGVCKMLLSDMEESLDYLQRSLALFEAIGNKEFTAGVLANIASIYSSTGKHGLALETMFKNIAIAEELGSAKMLGNAYNNIGNVYHGISDYAKSLEYFLKAHAIYENGEVSVGEAIYINIGSVLTELGDYDEALGYYQKALDIIAERAPGRSHAIILGNMGVIYTMMGNSQQAQDSLEQAIELYKEIGDKVGHSRDLINLGQVYQQSGRFEAALALYRQAADISLKDDHNSQASILHSIGEIYTELGDFEKAIASLNEGLDLAKKHKFQRTLTQIYLALSDVFKRTGDYLASLEYYKEHATCKDQLLNEEKQKVMIELQAKFMLEKTERERESFKNRNEELSGLLEEVQLLNNQLMEADAEKNDLVGIIAHDLKNPLSSIRLLARFLKESYGDNEDIVDIGNDIESSSKRMFDLIDDLLKANQMESGNFRLNIESHDMGELVNTVLDQYSMIAGQKNITFKKEFSMAGSFVAADRSALLQILDNLVSNAVKYSPYDKTITVGVSQLSEMTRIVIQDEGPGLNDNDKSRLFQKFARLSAQSTGGEHSTGLGLYIAKKLTESMNGSISCESEPGKGAAFIVEFPSVHESIEI